MGMESMGLLANYVGVRGVSFQTLPSGSIRCRLGKSITGDGTIRQFVGDVRSVLLFVEDGLNVQRRRVDSTLDLTQRDKGDASSALDYLRSYNVDLSLLEVCKLYVSKLPQGDPITVCDAVDSYLDMQSDAVSATYYRNLKTYFGKFVRLLGTQLMHEIDGDTLDDWLLVNTTGKSKKTYDNYLTAIKTFCNYCIKRRWIVVDPSADLFKFNADVGAVSVLGYADLQAVLQGCVDIKLMDLLLIFAIQSLAGVRRAEVCRLTWGKIGEDAIRLDKGVTKTKKGRGVDICKALKQILELYPQYLDVGCKDDLIYSGNHDKIDTMRDQLLRHLGWDHMPKNVLRHSYCSYRLALLKDPAKVAYEAGNSPDVLAQHYDAVVSLKEAKKYFCVDICC